MDHLFDQVAKECHKNLAEPQLARLIGSLWTEFEKFTKEEGIEADQDHPACADVVEFKSCMSKQDISGMVKAAANAAYECGYTSGHIKHAQRMADDMRQSLTELVRSYVPEAIYTKVERRHRRWAWLRRIIRFIIGGNHHIRLV